MKPFRRISLLLFILISYSIFSSCKKKDDPEPALPTIVQVLRHSNEFDSLIVALDRTWLLNQYEYAPEYLNGYPFYAPNKGLRLLAPPNKAFVRLLDSLHLKSINEIPFKDLRRLMDYLGFVEEFGTTLKENFYLPGEFSDYVLRFTNNGKRVWSSSKDFSDIYMEYTCINGKILVVDKVLFPPIPSVPPTKTSKEIIESNPDLDSLDVAMNLAGYYSGVGRGTLLAPNNKAFVDFLNLIYKDKISDIPPYILSAIIEGNTMLDIVVRDQFVNNSSIKFGNGTTIDAQHPYGIYNFIRIKNIDSGIYLSVDNRKENENIRIVSTEDIWTDSFKDEQVATYYYNVIHITDKIMLPSNINLTTLDFY